MGILIQGVEAEVLSYHMEDKKRVPGELPQPEKGLPKDRPAPEKGPPLRPEDVPQTPTELPPFHQNEEPEIPSLPPFPCPEDSPQTPQEVPPFPKEIPPSPPPPSTPQAAPEDEINS